MIDKQKQYDVEVSGLMVSNNKNVNMIIVQPWNGNSKHNSPSAYRGFVPGEGYRRVVLKGVEYKALGSIHTHPGNGPGAYQGPSGPGNAYGGGDGDLGFWRTLNGLSVFTIGVSEVSKLNPSYPFKNVSWADTNGSYYGNRHAIGSTNGLLNGNYSLFNFLR
jgi:hypothetical protein